MDVAGDNLGVVLAEVSLAGNGRKIGDRYDLDLSEHPELKRALEAGSDNIFFEMTENFPDPGNYYIAYHPVVLNGETRAMVGYVYNFGSFKRHLYHNMNQLFLFIGMSAAAVIIILLMISLYFLAIRPVQDVRNALVDYTEDKSYKMIVKKMYDIKSQNEIGYLADVVSDLALEIDLYTKENARIAAEKEHAQRELYEAKVQVMISQIRPHFMYNTLSSIAMLCKLNPDTAYEATVQFSDYLRGNMDSLKQTAPVPFEKELEHLKKYLYIEKLRFAHKLNIEYDIQATEFYVPMLSLQPIVENAVKHGVGMKKGGGTVRISTAETDDAYEITVTDDGVGFDVNAPKKDDGRTHIGMENTKKRLKDLCGADIIITSQPGEGTTARIIIPKKQEEDE